MKAGTEAWESLPPSVRELPAVALVPLVEQEKVVGLFGVGRREPFGDAERSLLLALAEVVGSALHRADVLETLEQRVQVRTRELAEANERLTELDRLKSNFVSNVSHELRTPITNVLLYLDLLQQPGREERRPTYLQVLRHESERLGHLIEDLLTLSRVDQEALKISRELRSLDPLLGEVAAAHRARAQAKGVALTLEPNPDVPPVWIGYQPMIQVFNNLVANAVAYTQPGGSVTLGSLVSPSAQGETLVGARVWNEGPPIPPEDIPQLFQRFFRGRTGREFGRAGHRPGAVHLQGDRRPPRRADRCRKLGGEGDKLHRVAADRDGGLRRPGVPGSWQAEGVPGLPRRPGDGMIGPSARLCPVQGGGMSPPAGGKPWPCEWRPP